MSLVIGDRYPQGTYIGERVVKRTDGVLDFDEAVRLLAKMAANRLRYDPPDITADQLRTKRVLYAFVEGNKLVLIPVEHYVSELEEVAS